MDEQEMNRLPGEVVEVYRQPLSGEVVELYSRPLPGASRQAAKPSPPPEQAKKRHSKKGLWIFLGCFALAAALAAAAAFWSWSGARTPRIDPFDYDYREPEDTVSPRKITIPTWPWGLGGSLPL